MVGKTLGHYEILEPLGRGGMGEVYRARDTKLDRDVAIKVLPADFAADANRIARFEREAKVIAALDHPNIVTVYSVEEVDGLHFITMQLVEGETLADVIPRNGLPLDAFFRFAIALCDAISSAHQRGVTHRDLKPANVMVAGDRDVKVLDFGLAKVAFDDVDEAAPTQIATEHLTEEGKILGTVAYMSPEQAEGKPVDHRSDIFSLGIILYQMATGVLPFDGDTKVSIISSIVKDAPTSITERNQALPRHLGRIVKHALEKDVARRYESALDLRNDLVQLQEEIESGELVAGSAVPGGRTRPPRPLWVAAIMALAVLVVAVGYLSTRGGGESLTRWTSTQLTAQPGQERFPRLSPDGEWFIYQSVASGNWDIYLQRVGAQSPTKNLTEEFVSDDVQPAFSFDGDSIAFRSQRDGGGIFVMDLNGESVRKISDFGFNPAWSPDGSEIVVGTESSWSAAMRGFSNELWAIDTASGDRRLVYRGNPANPEWSPNGERIAFWQIEGGVRNIWTVPAEGGAPTRVTDSPSVDWNPAWAPDGRHLYFISDRGGIEGLWRVAVDEETGVVSGDPEPVASPSGVRHPSFSRNGERIALISVEGRSNLQRVGFDPAEAAIVGTPAWVTRGSNDYVQPSASADGEWLTFLSGFPQRDLYVVRTDGTGLRAVTNDSFSELGPRWTLDGRAIFFYGDRDGDYDIWRINPDGGGAEQLTFTEGAVNYPVLAPDGSSVAYTLYPADKAVATPHVLDLEEGATPISLPTIDDEDGFRVWSWSPDGEWLLGNRVPFQGSATGIYRYSLITGEYEQITETGNRPVWLTEDQLLFYRGGTIVWMDLGTGDAHDVLTLDGLAGIFSVSADKTNLYFSVNETESDVWLMQKQ